MLTFDNGMQAITEVRRTVLRPVTPATPAHLTPLFIPAGAMGNWNDVHVMPDQGLLVESDAAMDKYGDPFAVVQAQAMAGYDGIAADTHAAPIEVFTLYFEQDQVIYLEGALLVLCPVAHISLDVALSGRSSAYDMLNAKDSAFLAACIAVQNQVLQAA